MSLQPMYPGKAFSPVTTLTNNIGAADTVIEVDDISAFPPAPNYATINVSGDTEAETIQYNAIAGNTLSGCIRGKEGIAQSWNAGIPVANSLTAELINNMINNINSVDNKIDEIEPGASIYDTTVELVGDVGEVIEVEVNTIQIPEGEKIVLGQTLVADAGFEGANSGGTIGRVESYVDSSDIPKDSVVNVKIITKTVGGVTTRHFDSMDEWLIWRNSPEYDPNVLASLPITEGEEAVTRQEVERIVEASAAVLRRESEVARQITNRIYEGVDLTDKFAFEIMGYANPWAWIQARINDANWTGLNVGDYIPFKTSDGYNFKAEIAGIDTYHNYGDTPVGHHIDFITRDCYPTTHVFNKVDYNNGTTVSPSPWLASDLYHWLNSLQGQVPGSTTAGGTPPTNVDYRTTGVYDKLPSELQAVIVQKRVLLPSRYSAGLLLTDDNSWAWANAGKLWIPSEVEVYGCNMWGSNLSPNQGWSSGGFVQYPIFAQNMKRIKMDKDKADGGADPVRTIWCLSSAYGGNSTSSALVGDVGNAYRSVTTNSTIRVTLCFRIMQKG